MTGLDIQNVNETEISEANAALVSAFAAGAHEPDTVEPDGGVLTAALVHLAAIADPMC